MRGAGHVTGMGRSGQEISSKNLEGRDYMEGLDKNGQENITVNIK
jgi:hypothetical protein